MVCEPTKTKTIRQDQEQEASISELAEHRIHALGILNFWLVILSYGDLKG